MYDEKNWAQIFRLQSCISGFALIRLPDFYAEDQCLMCPPATYAFEAADSQKEILRPEKAELVTGPLLCLDCPKGALCPRGTQVYPKRGYWRGTNMVCQTSGCDRDSTCNPNKCEALAGPALPGTDADGELWRVRAMVYRCKASRCKQKTTEELRDEGVISRRSDNSSSPIWSYVDQNLCFEGAFDCALVCCGSGGETVGASGFERYLQQRRRAGRC